ncbi:EamA family transporter [Nakamurella lactea]|uniref:EamA family transporter n=1 Tax=Nakamurella lactea TaxID=459515 RepID=UPI000408914D|nr:DMT family transporter [Nakamurella lactea]
MTDRGTIAAAQTPAAGTSILPGVGFGLLSAATFGSSGVVVRPLLDAGWSAGAAVLLRIGLAAILLIGPGLSALRGRWHLVRRRAGLLALFGLFAVAGSQVCYFNAVQHLSIGVALLLEYSGIVLIVGWVWLRTRVRPATLTLIGAGVAIVGLVLVLDVLGATRVSPIGVLWGLGAAVGLAVYYVLAARTEDGLPPLLVVTAGMVTGSVALGLAGMVGLLPMTVVFTDVQLGGVTMSWLVPVAWLGVMTAAVAYVAGVQAGRRLGATMASFLGLTEVLFAIVFAALVLSEVPALIQLFGGALVLAGVVLVRLGSRDRNPQPGTPVAAG